MIDTYLLAATLAVGGAMAGALIGDGRHPPRPVRGAAVGLLGGFVAGLVIAQASPFVRALLG